MSKIDIDKFVTDLLDSGDFIHPNNIKAALDKQNLKYENGKLVKSVKKENRCLSFARDGDILHLVSTIGGEESEWIIKFKSIENGQLYDWYGYSVDGQYFFTFNYFGWGKVSSIKEARFANNEEKELLDKEIRMAGYKWNEKLKALVSIDDTDEWIPKSGDIVKLKNDDNGVKWVLSKSEHEPLKWLIYPVGQNYITCGFVSIYELLNEYELVERSSNEPSLTTNAYASDEILEEAIDFITYREDANDYICSELHDDETEREYCANNCTNLNKDCVLRYLKMELRNKKSGKNKTNKNSEYERRY